MQVLKQGDLMIEGHTQQENIMFLNHCAFGVLEGHRELCLLLSMWIAQECNTQLGALPWSSLPTQDTSGLDACRSPSLQSR